MPRKEAEASPPAAETAEQQAARGAEVYEYVAILAFDLEANGVALEQPLDGSKAASLVLHRDRRHLADRCARRIDALS